MVQKFMVEKFMIEKSGVGKSGVKKSVVEMFMVEKSGVEKSGMKSLGLKSPGLERSWLKSPGLKGLGLKLRVENPGLNCPSTGLKSLAISLWSNIFSRSMSKLLKIIKNVYIFTLIRVALDSIPSIGIGPINMNASRYNKFPIKENIIGCTNLSIV